MRSCSRLKSTEGLVVLPKIRGLIQLKGTRRFLGQGLLVLEILLTSLLTRTSFLSTRQVFDQEKKDEKNCLKKQNYQ